MTTTQLTAKDKALQIIHDQPDDSTVEELIGELLMHRMIERGLADSDAGRTISLEELKRRMDTWRK